MTSTIARANAAKARPSLLVPVNTSRDHSSGKAGSIGDVGSRVKFSEECEVKVMTPVTIDGFSTRDTERPPSPASMVSVASSVSSEVSATHVTKLLATRLSFWKTSDAKTSNVESDVDEEDRPLDSLIHEDMSEPQEVLSRIIETAAPPPTTIREKYTELETKILRQTIKEFAKGEMYYAYDFGKAIHSYRGNPESVT